MLPDLVSILLRLRKPAITVIGDLEKAFHQVALNDSDRDASRFLWVEDTFQPISPTNSVISFRFARAFFGVICNPFLLAAMIKQHLTEQKSKWASQVLTNIYVDNILLEAQNEEEAFDALKSAKAICQDAQMNLREFLSNNTRVNEAISVEDRHHHKSTRLTWHTVTDTLEFYTLAPPRGRITKRSLLRFIAQHFDPLGLMAPVILPLKIFLQDITKEEKGWDTPPTRDRERVWKRILSAWTLTTCIYFSLAENVIS